MAYRGRRSLHEGPWHFCGRCGSRVHISEMVWQRGVLLCTTYDCADKGVNPLIGDRERDLAKAFEIPSRELLPDPKLTPTTASEGGDDIIF